MGLEPNFTNNRLLSRSSLLPRVIFSATWPNWIGKFKTPWWFHDTWKMRNKHDLTIQSWCMLKKWWMFFVEWWLQTGLYGCVVCASSVLQHYWFRVRMILAGLSVFGFQTLTTKLVQRTPLATSITPLCWHTSWPKSGSKSSHHFPFWWSIIWITKLVVARDLLTPNIFNSLVFLGTFIFNKKLNKIPIFGVNPPTLGRDALQKHFLPSHPPARNSQKTKHRPWGAEHRGQLKDAKDPAQGRILSAAEVMIRSCHIGMEGPATTGRWNSKTWEVNQNPSTTKNMAWWMLKWASKWWKPYSLELVHVAGKQRICWWIFR